MSRTDSTLLGGTNEAREARQYGSRDSTGQPRLEPGFIDREGQFTFVKAPSESLLSDIHSLTLAEIGTQVASIGVVRNVYHHNPISFWAIFRANDANRNSPRFAGFWSCLPLNTRGHQALLDGSLNVTNPDLALLASKGEDPVAIYIWAIVARRTSLLAGLLVQHAVGLDLWQTLPVYVSVGTEDGLRSVKRLDRSQGLDEARIGSFLRIESKPEDWAKVRAMKVHSLKRQDTSRSLRPRLETVLASNPDQIAKVFAIRAAVFMAEQSCPYDEEFDGNDYSGSHVLGLVDGEPAAVLRMRYFADFVKLERLAVLSKFRRTLIGKLVVEHAINIARRKGYRQMYGHAQARLTHFWERFGFHPMSKNTRLVYSDHEYIEMVGEISPHDDALTVNSDPYVLVRPEGLWDQPGALDRSAARAATNPH
jgi:predicted GNAT family N-acyltransferase